ncbi:rhodanese-like domain-containing protein [Streptomyces sp. MAR4 CNY-716]
MAAAPDAHGADAAAPDAHGTHAAVRTTLERLTPRQAYTALADGAVLADTRPEFQRRASGTVPGALLMERNHLEWRCDPAGGASVAEATGTDAHWIVMCDEGYASSLAAASLRSLGLARATDLIGGFQAWRAAALPVTLP